MNQRALAWPVREWLLLVGILAVAMHAPGQLSVDSVIALHEAATGTAFGWAPTFQSAMLAWLGGGEIAAALHVALMVAIVLFCFEALLRRLEGAPVGVRLLAAILALNPLVWLMVGVVWRDVLLGVAVFAGASAIVVSASNAAPRKAWPAWSVVVLASAVAVMARQQGFLLAAVLMAGLFMQVELRGRLAGLRLRERLLRIGMWAALFASALVGLQSATTHTIAPASHSVTMDGWRLVMLYDIAGMWSMREPVERIAPAALPEALRGPLVAAYSPERVDGVLAVPGARDWAAAQERPQLARVWWSLFLDAPMAYVEHRGRAGWALLGGGDVRRCLPGYWGVAGLPEMLERLGMVEAMDARDRMIGRVSHAVAATPWMWNASYVLVLLGLLPWCWRRRREVPEMLALALGGLAYAGAFLASTVACDVRYLFPVAMLATALALGVVAWRPRPDEGAG